MEELLVVLLAELALLVVEQLIKYALGTHQTHTLVVP